MENTNRRSAAVMNWRNRTKIKLIEYKGGKCERCDYDKPIPNAYNFHHRDPLEKEFGISGRSWNFQKLKSEVDKCDLLCAVCHAEVHYFIDQENREKREKEVFRELLKNKHCKKCGVEFKPKNSKQSLCSIECKKKVNRPSKEELESELHKSSWCALGRKYGVSDNTVKKWAKSYGLV